MIATSTATKIQTVARFPKGTILENLAVRADNSLLVSSIRTRDVWYVPPAKAGAEVTPQRLFALDGESPMSFVETEPDVFYVCADAGYTSHASSLYRFGLRRWAPGATIAPERILAFPPVVGALNGSCLIGPRTILIADSFASLIWRVDLSENGMSAQASIWLKHYSMLYHPGEMKPEQPGVNGIRFGSRGLYVYYTATALKLLMRVRVDAETLAPAGSPEYLGGGKMIDDFCIDEDAGVAYVATHRECTIERMPLEPAALQKMVSVAGDPFDEQVVGVCSGAWSRVAGDYGKVAFFTTDGGTTALPPDGVLREAKVLRIEFSD